MTASELSRNIHALVTQKNYNEALALFKNQKINVEAVAITNNEFLIADMLTALRGTKAFDAAWQFISIYKINIDVTTPLRVLNSYGWMMYAALKSILNDGDKNASTNINYDLKIIELLGIFKQLFISEGMSEKLKYTLNLNEFLFKLMNEKLKNEVPQNLKIIIKLCENTSVQMLSTNCYSMQITRKGVEKEMEFASAREDWYATYTKALYAMQHYHECAKTSNEALATIENMHYNNQLWFNRRLAQCHMALNETDLALKIYSDIVNQKKDWFLFKELSECYFKLGENELALKNARQAARAFGPINFKVELIELLGDILHAKNEKKLAMKHYTLVKLIRESESWKPDNNLNKKIDKLSVEVPEENKSKDVLKQELAVYWNEKPAGSNAGIKLKGEIYKLLKANTYGTDGFIKSESGETYYFFVPAQHPFYNKLEKGIQVEFLPETTPKGKKAVKLRFMI